MLPLASTSSEKTSLVVNAKQEDTKARFLRLQILAENDNIKAQFDLGTAYLKGAKTKEDTHCGIQWLKKAATKGHVLAQFNLGCVYQRALGIERDIKQSIHWYLQAALQGNTDAQNNLGYIYESGLGMPINLNAAEDWYHKAALQDHPTALCNLAHLFMLKKDYAAATHWYGKANRLNSTRAETCLKDLVETRKVTFLDFTSLALYQFDDTFKVDDSIKETYYEGKNYKLFGLATKAANPSLKYLKNLFTHPTLIYVSD